MKRSLFLLTLLYAFTQVHCQIGFRTSDMDAQLDDTQILNAEVGSVLDSDNNTHIAWIKDVSGSRSLMYTVFESATRQFTTKEVIGASTEVLVGPQICLDDNENPHIVLIKKREENGSIKSGNYAVMYAGDDNGDGTFDISQVSTNPLSPADDTDGIYNCYVNGRPQIFWGGHNLYVGYTSDANSLTNWDQYYIIARKSGNSWNHNQEFSLETSFLGGTYATNSGMAIARNSGNNTISAYIDLSDYSPRYIYEDGNGWNMVTIPGYDDIFGNDHAQRFSDDAGNQYFAWYNETNEKFCLTQISGSGSYSSIIETPTGRTSTGNFYPVTVDKTLQTPVYHYRTLTGDRYLLVGQADGSTLEYQIEDKGVVYGKTSLHANNGYISLVTASESQGKIYVTQTQDITSLTEGDTHSLIMSLSPNPVRSTLSVTSERPFTNIVVMGISGNHISVVRIPPGTSADINLDYLSPGIYFIKISNSAESFYTIRKFIKS